MKKLMIAVLGLSLLGTVALVAQTPAPATKSDTAAKKSTKKAKKDTTATDSTAKKTTKKAKKTDSTK